MNQNIRRITSAIVPKAVCSAEKQKIDDGGEMREILFTSTGRGYTGVYNNYLYYMGKLQKADSGSKYEVFTIQDGDSSKNYVINTSGRIAKNTTVKDRDGIKYKTNSGGVSLKRMETDRGRAWIKSRGTGLELLERIGCQQFTAKIEIIKSAFSGGIWQHFFLWTGKT